MKNKAISLILFIWFVASCSCAYAKSFYIHQSLSSDTIDLYDQFVQAAMDGDTSKLNHLIGLGIEPDSAIYEGVTPLMYAAQEGQVNAMRLLLKHGANVNSVPDNKVTALHSAVWAGQKDAALLLLYYGAEINVLDNIGLTPLLIAVQRNDTILAYELIQAGADVFTADYQGGTALHMATANGNTELMAILLGTGINIDQPDNLGFTALMFAAEQESTELTELLLLNGADPNITNKEDLSALSIAILNNNTPVAEILLLNGAEPNHLHKKAKDHYFFAQQNGNKDTWALLKKYGARRNWRPIFEQPFVGMDVSGSSKIFMTGISAGIHELKNKLSFQLTFLMNPFAHSTLEKREDIIYQFWEHSYRIQTEAARILPVRNIYSGDFGFTLGLLPSYSWGRYRGTDFKPDADFTVQPIVGTYFMIKDFGIKLRYIYELPGLKDKHTPKLNLLLLYFLR